MDSVDGGLTEPTLAAHFAGDRGLTSGDGLGEGVTQIKIAADTFVVKTIEAEHGLRVLRVNRVFDVAVPGDTFRAKVSELHRQRLQFPKLLREAGRLMGSLAFLPAVIRARCEFLVTHNIRFFFQVNPPTYQTNSPPSVTIELL